ncbi:hypothetical protein [Halarchaeum sp. P4]|uniref:hypothetical protein n=1 Tax=Halarchaeum sp. P4 TaxID=3421639 RepID=UPI003EBC9314
MTEDAAATRTSTCAPMDVAPELHADPAPTGGENDATAVETTEPDVTDNHTTSTSRE